jgi:uncharacterized membrane protein (UPF0127 family)
MKHKILITSIFVLVVVLAMMLWWFLPTQNTTRVTPVYPVPEKKTNSVEASEKKVQITIGGNTWLVEIADTEAEQTLGLSGRASLVEKTGLLFTFAKMNKQYFWMKDMLFPIDMIFFDAEWKIVLIESNVKPETFPATFGGQVLAKYVLEVNAGEAKMAGLKVGDQAVFQNN